MARGLNVCDELQDLQVNCPMSYFIKGFFTESFCRVVPVAIEVFLSSFFFCLLSGSSRFFTGFSRLCCGINGRSI